MLRRAGWCLVTVLSYEDLAIDVECENDGYTSNVGDAGRLSSSFIKYSKNIPLNDSSVGLQNFSRSGNRAREKTLIWG
jgi:hypothetical protein